MIPKIENYKRFIGLEGIERIYEKSEGLKGKSIINVNSSYSGGGVAELLNSLIILMNRLGIKAGWRLLKGSHSFFIVTKKIHNALQGQAFNFSKTKKKLYLEEIERNSLLCHFSGSDLVVIHDPQPLPWVDFSSRKQPWLWRCHIDISNVYKPTWDFLKGFLRKYDGMIVSTKSYRRKDVKVPQHIIMPSIDPLSLKNKDLTSKQSKNILESVGIPLDKPLVTQVSRFDKWKNPLGVIRIFEKVRKKVDSRLVFIGDVAEDDPEYYKIYEKVIKKTKENPDIININQKGDLIVNALQKESSVIFQNSIKEGFGLTVSEALWKRTPVITRNVGGIPLQVKHEKTGILAVDDRDAVSWCIKLLKDKKLNEKIGNAGHEHVKENFLITRHLEDYLDLFHKYI